MRATKTTIKRRGRGGGKKKRARTLRRKPMKRGGWPFSSDIKPESETPLLLIVSGVQNGFLDQSRENYKRLSETQKEKFMTEHPDEYNELDVSIN